MDSRSLNRSSRLTSAAVSAICELLEERRLLSLTPTQQFIHDWNNMGPRFRHDLAVLEYVYPASAARLDTDLESLGLTPIAPEAGTLQGISASARRVRRRPQMKGILAHIPRPHKAGKGFHPDLLTAPEVTDATYYNALLPNQVAFTFDDAVTSTNWNSAVSVLNLNTGATIPVSGTYSSALNTIVYNLNSSTILPNGNYAAILHGSQVTDVTNSLSAVGSDGVAGDDYESSFYFFHGDVNPGRTIGLPDLAQVLKDFNDSIGVSYASGDTDYDGTVGLTDLAYVLKNFNATLPILGTPDQPRTTEVGSAQLTIAWDAPSDTNVTEYDVYRNSTLIASGVTATTYPDVTLTPQTSYDYFVVGRDAAGDSSWESPELVAQTAPAISTASFQSTVPQQIVFKFSNGVSEYRVVERALSVLDLNSHTAVPIISSTYNPSTDSETFALSTTASLATGNYDAILHGSMITDSSSGLALAGDDGIAGHDSNLDFTVGTLALLGTPGTPTAYVASSSSADVFWDPPSDTLVTEYDLYRNSTLIASNIADAGTSGTLAGAGYYDASLSTNTTYGYYVVGKDASGDSSWESTETYIDITPATPTYSLSGDDNVTEGDTYYLDGAFGDANNDEPTEWTIDWGDGSGTTTYSGFIDDEIDSNDDIGGPADAFHTYSKGTYTITGSALSNIGTYAANSVVVTVTDATPTFSVLGDETFIQGQPYTVSASFTDFDAPSGWTLSWGDGTTNSTGTGNIPATLTHTYTTGSVPRTINAYITTVDGTYTNSSVVEEAEPTFSVTGSTSTTLGQTYVLSETFSDPAGQSPLYWVVDWGDGSDPTSALGSTSTLTHVYTQTLSDSGGYTMAAYAVDNDGTYYAAPAEVTVTPAAPAISLSIGTAFTAGVGDALVNHSTDPGDVTIDDWTISWGDGTTSWIEGDTGSFPHTYSLPGTFTATAIADTEQATYAGTIGITVHDPGNPEVTFDQYAVQNQLTTTDYLEYGSFDPAEFATGYTVSWGDGTTSSAGGGTGTNAEFTHIYQTYGTLTMTAEIDSNVGTYTTSAAVYIDPNLTFSIGGPDSVESGNTAIYEVDYDGSGPLPTYTINWGDGSGTTTGNSRNPTHAYIFERYLNGGTYTADTRLITFSASEGTSSVSWEEVSPLIWPNYGAGTLTPGGTIMAVEGQPVTLSASFSDPSYTAGGAYTAPAWSIEWDANNPDSGDITFANATSASASNTYGLAGTYTVVWGVGYEDSDSPFTGGNKQPFQILAEEQVVVQHATPTVSISETNNSSDKVEVTPNFTLPPGSAESYPSWTITWGDGSTTTNASSGANFHQYATEGSYAIHVVATTDEGVYTALATTVEAEPTVGITDQNGAAYVQGVVPDYFVITRSFADSLPLTINFSKGGSAATTNEFELTDAITGQILSSSITIPAGQQFCTIAVSALGLSSLVSPHWTDTLGITLTSNANYAIDSLHPSASTEIVDSDLRVTLSDGSRNLILDGSADGTKNLVPLVLTVPQQAKTGAIITLSDSVPSEADVWTTATPTPEDQPILGMVDGTAVASVTYSASDPPPETLWVGAIGGSTNVDDINFTLSDSDANATPAPQHATTGSETSNAGTATDLEIIMYNDPNNTGSLQTDIAGTTQNYLVGQLVDVQAVLKGPAAWTNGVAYLWDVQGHVAHDISEPDSQTSRKVTNLLYDNGQGLVGGQHAAQLGAFAAARVPTGLARNEINFFWISTTGRIDADSVTVAAIPWKLSGSPEPLFQASVTFDVYTPIAFADAVPGAPQVVFRAAQNDWQIGMQATPASLAATLTPAGIVWNAIVNQPLNAGFSEGTFNFLQIATGLSTIKYPDGSGANEVQYGETGVDNSDPYAAVLGIVPWTTTTGYHSLNDSPAIFGDMQGAIDEMTVNKAFKVFVMYRPPGAGSFSVPVLSLNWSFIITAKEIAPGAWVPVGTPSQSPLTQVDFTAETQEPEWTIKLVNGKAFPPHQ